MVILLSSGFGEIGQGGSSVRLFPSWYGLGIFWAASSTGSSRILGILMRFLTILLLAIPILVLAETRAAPEPGFTPLFTGMDLNGWKMQKGNVSLQGKTEAYRKRFFVQDQELIIDEKLKGNAIIETEKSFSGNMVLRCEYKPGKGCNNDLYLQGIKFDLTPKQVPNLQQDEWNTLEIAIRDGQAQIRNNQQLLTTKKTKPGATPFGIRAEFGPIRFRNIRVQGGN